MLYQQYELKIIIWLLLLLIVVFISSSKQLEFIAVVEGFVISSKLVPNNSNSSSRLKRTSFLSSSTNIEEETERTNDNDNDETIQQQKQHNDESSSSTKKNYYEKSYWKSKQQPRSRYQERIVLKDLQIGQELVGGYVVQELLQGRTGPKLFFECGIGRINPNDGTWSIVHGMLRLGRSGKKITKKRADRFKQPSTKNKLYVSRIQLESGRLELCSKPSDVDKYTTSSKKISVSSLSENQVVSGDVIRVHPYGVIVDIGANQNGLLHITKVARLLNQKINKKKGLEEAGLEKGAKVQLQVESVIKRRVSLDFTEDVKEEARRGSSPEKEKKQQESIDNNDADVAVVHSIDDDELASWEEYAKQQYDDNDIVDGGNNDNKVDDKGDDDDDDDYEYDEDSEIEAALGLDTY